MTGVSVLLLLVFAVVAICALRAQARYFELYRAQRDATLPEDDDMRRAATRRWWLGPLAALGLLPGLTRLREALFERQAIPALERARRRVFLWMAAVVLVMLLFGQSGRFG